MKNFLHRNCLPLAAALLAICCLATVKGDGKTFLVAFPPTKDGDTGGRCQVLIDSKYIFATVTIQRANGNSATYSVSPYRPLRVNYGTNLRTVGGLEGNRALVITSDYDISVSVLNEASNMYADAAFAQPVDDTTTEFYLHNEANNNIGDCGTDQTIYSYAVMMARDDTTLVNVLNPDGSVNDQFYLDTYQTYTATRVYERRGQSFSRFKVESSKPLAVISGNACFCNGNVQTSSPIFDFVPAISKLGSSHIIPPMPIRYSNGQDYILTVLATQQTILDVTGQAGIILQAGEVYTKTVGAEVTQSLTCSQPCLVSVTLKNLGPSFMSFIPPTSAYNREVYFSFPSPRDGTAVDLTVLLATDGEDSLDSYLLDGEPLNSDNWVCGPDADSGIYYCTAELTLFEKSYNITNTAGGSEDTFSVMSYVGITDVEGDYIGRGYGAQLATYSQAADSIPPPTVTQPSAPFYNFYHNGDFESSNSEVITQDCQINYGVDFKTRASDLIPTVNSLVGDTLCSDVPAGAIRIITVSTLFTTDAGDTEGTVDMKWRLFAEDTVDIATTDACAAELAAYLSLFDNWGEPILPPREECVAIDFPGSSFTSGVEGWDCSVEAPSQTQRYTKSKRTDELKSGLVIYGYFLSDNDEIISGGCSNQFRDGFNASSIAMVEDVNTRITNGQLCDTIPVSIQSSSIVWTLSGDKGTTEQILVLDPPEDLAFADVQSCMDEIVEYMIDQSNWDDPIIPDVTNCPTTVFTDFSFEERDRYYSCP